MFVPILFESHFDVSSVRSVSAAESHRRHVMGLQQSLIPAKEKREVRAPEMGKASLDASSYYRIERGSQDLEILFPLKEPVHHVVRTERCT